MGGVNSHCSCCIGGEASITHVSNAKRGNYERPGRCFPPENVRLDGPDPSSPGQKGIPRPWGVTTPTPVACKYLPCFFFLH